MLGAAETDALGTPLARVRGLVRRVGVRSHVQQPRLVGVAHQPIERPPDRLLARLRVAGAGALQLRLVQRQLAHVDTAGEPVDRDDVPLLHGRAVRGERPRREVDLDRVRAAHGRDPLSARDDRRVGVRSAGAREDALRRDHAVVVVRRRLPADEDHALATVRPLLRVVGREHHLAARRSGRGVEAARDRLRLRLRGDHPLEQLLQPVRVHPQQRLVVRDQLLGDHVRGHHPFRERRPLADARLEDPELALLDRELDVAHVVVVTLERRHHVHQAAVRSRIDLLELGERERVADAGDDVLPLGVREVVTVRLLLPGRGIPRERDAGAGVHAAVAEHHRNDVHGRSEVVGDLVLPAIVDRAATVPGAEDGLDRELHLLPRVLRELRAGVLAVDLQEAREDLLEVVGVEVGVLRVLALAMLRLVERVLEGVAGHVHHDLAEHLDEPAVGVPGETPVVVGLLREALHRLVVEPEIQDGVHHPRHRELRAAPHAHEQRVVGVSETLAHRLLEGAEVLLHLVGEAGREVSVVEVGEARLGRGGEAGRHRKTHVGHLGEVRALASEEVLHVLVALGEVVDVLGHRASGNDRGGAGNASLGRRTADARAEDVAEADDPEDVPPLDDGEVAEPLREHHVRRILGVGLRRNGDWVPRHPLLHA